VVVDFSVENNPRFAIVRDHWLQATVRQIENGKAAMAEGDVDGRAVVSVIQASLKRIMQTTPTAGSDQETFAIWAPMNESIIHLLQMRTTHAASGSDHAGNSAHRDLLCRVTG
jgi:uncharacterized protein YgbK (DUF1537 family)